MSLMSEPTSPRTTKSISRRRLVLLPFLFMLLLGACRSSGQATEAYQNTIVQTGLFTAPSSGKGSLIATIPAGTSLTVYEEKDGWLYVDYSGTRGWIYSSFAAPEGTAASLVRGGSASDGSGSETPMPPANLEADVILPSLPDYSSVSVNIPRFDTGETEPVPTQPAPTQPAPTEPAAPAPAQPAGYNDGVVHALAMSELDAIVANYDGNVTGYGTDGERDPDNCPSQVRRYQERMAQYGVKVVGDESRKVIYLTFPMGWEKAPNTETILNILRDKGVKATFYVTHEYADRNQGLIQRMINEGHEVGSHGYSHPTNGIAYLSIIEQMLDAVKMQQYMRDTFSYTMHKYNFNSSAWSHQALALMTQMGYQVCFYSYNYIDYLVDQQPPADQVLANLTAALFPGCIYYLHAVSDANTQALAAFIDAARARGYEFAGL